MSRQPSKRSRVDYEDRFANALTRIAAYMTPNQLRRQAERAYGLAFEEALEMSYENVRGEAIAALKGYRRTQRRKDHKAKEVNAMENTETQEAPESTSPQGDGDSTPSESTPETPAEEQKAE